VTAGPAGKTPVNFQNLALCDGWRGERPALQAATQRPFRVKSENFRSTPMNGHFQSRSVCLKGATNRHREATTGLTFQRCAYRRRGQADIGYQAAGLHLSRFHEYRRLALACWSIDTDQLFEGLVQAR
jgi:hypothetical protein